MAGDPDAVLAAAAQLAAVAEGFTSSAEGVRAAGNELAAGWSGAAAASAGDVLTRIGTSATVPGDVVTAARPILETYAQALREAQERFALGEQMVEQGTRTQLAEATQPATRGNDQVLTQAATRVTEGEAMQAAAVAAEAQANQAAAAGIEGLTAQLAAMTIPAVGAGPGVGAAPGAGAAPGVGADPGVGAGAAVVGPGNVALAGFGPPGAAPPVEDEGWSFSDIGHAVLDVGGLVPVLGEPLDLANAAWYGAEGDYVSAALSAGAAVPVAGWVFTGGKFLNKGVKLVDSAADARVWLRNRPPMVPRNAIRLPFEPNAQFQTGERFLWTKADGTKVRYHAHGRDSTAPPGTNAARGPVYRVKEGKNYMDSNGVGHKENHLKETSSKYDPAAANATHIPYPANLPPPGAERVLLPNALSLADGQVGGGDHR